MGAAASAQRRHPVADGLTFRFEFAPSTYAVACGHDEDRDGAVNKNWLGIPTEGRPTSNNVKPALRAPTVDESAIALGSAFTVSLTMRY